MKLNVLLILALLPFITKAQPPEQDCVGALVVCSPHIYFDTGYTGNGQLPNEINGDSSCLGDGERHSVWLKISILSAGDLNFTITPDIQYRDYDWAVYNLTNSPCSSIYGDLSLEVSCDYSGSTYPTQATGPNGGPNPQDEPVIPVLANQIYYIYISNNNNSPFGFGVDFSASTCTMAPTFAQLAGIISPQYFQYTIDAVFDSYVLCNSVQASDFTLYNTQTGFNYTITNAEPIFCDGPGDTTETKFRLSIFPQLAANTDYTLVRNGVVHNMCGLISSSNDTVTFTSSLALGVEDATAPIYTVNILTAGNAVISSSLPLSGNFNLYNLSGMLMQTKHVENTSSIELPMDGYTQGLYILSFTNTQGQTYSTKIVKSGN